MDHRHLCLLVLFYLNVGFVLVESEADKGIELFNPTFCIDDCLYWTELDNKAAAANNGQCLRLRLCQNEDSQDNPLCQVLENCHCDLSKGQKQLICRNNGWSSEETRYECQEKKTTSYFRRLFQIISYPFKFLWYLLSQLVALFNWLIRTIFSVIQFVLLILFKPWVLMLIVCLIVVVCLYWLAAFLIYRAAIYSFVDTLNNFVTKADPACR